MRRLSLLLLLLALLAAPAAGEDGYTAPTAESYDLERLAKAADLVILVDVTKIEAERKGNMIVGGPGSVVDFIATVREILKGDLAAADVVVRAVGHKFYQSGRLLTGPALFYTKRPAGEKGGRPVLEIADPFGKFFLKVKEEPEIKEFLERAAKAVDLVEPVREGTPVAPPGPPEPAAPAAPERKPKPKPIPVPILEGEGPAETPAEKPAARPKPSIESVIQGK